MAGACRFRPSADHRSRALRYGRRSLGNGQRDQRLKQSNHLLRLSGTELAGLPYVAFGHQMPDVYRVRGKVVLDQRSYPPLIWVPPDNDWRNAKQLWAEELEPIMGKGAKVVRMTVETAPGEATMVVPNPVPPVLLSLCSPEYERLWGHSGSKPGEPSYIPSNNIGEQYEYRPLRVLSICKLLSKQGS